MNSPGHRRNLLDCGAKTFAVGVVYSANGTPYYTQVFGSR
ncbi:CAP domain-containing protein [Couchioplanes caeruleus subsp. azureus]